MTYKALTTDIALGQSIVDSIVTDAVALNYSCVESRYVHGDITWAVIKNPASLNYFQSDWHLALGYQNSTYQHVYFSVFEDWNTSSKMATAYAPGVTTSWAPTNSYTCGRSPSQLNSGFNFTATSRNVFTLSVNSIMPTEPYWYSIDADRLALGLCVNSTSDTTRAALYAGAYERFLPSSLDPVPIILGQFLGPDNAQGIFVSRADSATGAATREPGQTVANSSNFAAGYHNQTRTYIDGSMAWTPLALAQQNRRDSVYTANELYSNRPMVSRIPVCGRQENGLRGLFIGMYWIGSTVAQSGSEARWTFGANTYVATKIRGTQSVGEGSRFGNNLYMEQL